MHNDYVNTRTLKELQAQASTLGFVVTKTDGEYRVALKGKKVDTEDAAYYTYDIDDAFAMLEEMAKDNKVAQ